MNKEREPQINTGAHRKFIGFSNPCLSASICGEKSGTIPTIILKAKDFATEITIHNAREQSMSCEAEISNEHVTNNQAVRDTLLSRGIRPESLTPAEDVKKVERRLASAQKKALKNPDGLVDK
ncbi:MAG: hypothetical protein JKY81_09510 [Colwellia sp.]|nr:hypothetical protein [Colwellia sp.]